MAGLVDQLQTDALDASIPVATLLRKVKVAATKLGLNDALVWVERELGGYKSHADVPDYRKASGSTMALNPYRGWIPIQFNDHKTADLVAKIVLYESISNYEAILASGEGSLRIDLPNELVETLNEHLNMPVPRITNTVARGSIVRVVQSVRDMVLEWALELERVGITGEGLSFSGTERERANVSQISIGEFHGSFNTGNASGAGASISQTVKTQNNGGSAKLFDDIVHALAGVVNEPARRELADATSAMRNAADRPTLIAAYQRFATLAADHMTILGPFFPALAGLLS